MQLPLFTGVARLWSLSDLWGSLWSWDDLQLPQDCPDPLSQSPPGLPPDLPGQDDHGYHEVDCLGCSCLLCFRWVIYFCFCFLSCNVWADQSSYHVWYLHFYSLRYEPAPLVLRRTRKEAVWSESRKQQAQAFRLSHLAQILQSLRDPPVSLLGCLRSGQSQRLRADWREGLHSVLGTANVRGLLLLQHDRPPQHAHRHDVQLLSVHLSQIWHVSFRESLSLLVLFWFQRKVCVLNF